MNIDGGFTDVEGNTLGFDEIAGSVSNAPDGYLSSSNKDAIHYGGRRGLIPSSMSSLPVVYDTSGGIRYRLDLVNGPDNYLYIATKDSNGNYQEVRRDDDSGSGTESRISFSPSADVQYYALAGWYSANTSGNYNMQFRYEQGAGDQNGVVYSLSSGQTVPAVIGTAGALVAGATVETYTVDTVASPITAQVLESQGQSHDGVISPNMHNNNALFDVQVAGAESGSTVEYSLDNTNWTTDYIDLRGQVVEGDNTVYVRHTDVAGNVSETTTNVTVDLTAPVMTGMTDGAGVDTTGTVTFTMSFSEPVRRARSSLPTSTSRAATSPRPASLRPVSPVQATRQPGTSIDVTFTGISGDGNFAAALATAAGYTQGVYDLAGNHVQFEAGEDRLSADNVGVQEFDTVGVTVTGITRVPDLDTSVQNDTGSSATDGVTDADVLTFRVDFSEPVDAHTLRYGIPGDLVPNFDIIALESSDNTDVASSFTDASLSVTNLDGTSLDAWCYRPNFCAYHGIGNRHRRFRRLDRYRH